MATTTYVMDELEQRTGVPARTIRYWVSQRLLPRPRGVGRGAEYDERHLRRVHAIKALRDEGCSLSSIRGRLAGLDERAVELLFARANTASVPVTVPEPPTAPTYPGVPCEVIELMDGIALLVVPSRGELVRRIAADIYRHYAHRTSLSEAGRGKSKATECRCDEPRQSQ